MKNLLMPALAALLISVAAPAAATELATTTLTIGTHKLTAEVATTPSQLQTGLMNRFSLKPDHGMLFIFERPEPQVFWMRNTFIALSAAFISADGTILNIEDMRPQTDDPHWSRGAALYVLEMKKGWFAERGILPGMSVKGIPALPTKR